MTSTWFSVTAFDVSGGKNEIAIIEDVNSWPTYVRKVWGGREICPKSGKLHFQGCLQTWSSIRPTGFKDWLPTAHFEKARCVEALKKYGMKNLTAEGEKTIRENPKRYYTAQEICMKLGSYKICQSLSQTDRQDNFWWRVRRVLVESPELAGQLMNPSLRNFYGNTSSVWEGHAIVLQHVPDTSSECGGCGRDECEYCDFISWSKV